MLNDFVTGKLEVERTKYIIPNLKKLIAIVVVVVIVGALVITKIFSNNEAYSYEQYPKIEKLQGVQVY